MSQDKGAVPLVLAKKVGAFHIGLKYAGPVGIGGYYKALTAGMAAIAVGITQMREMKFLPESLHSYFNPVKLDPTAAAFGIEVHRLSKGEWVHFPHGVIVIIVNLENWEATFDKEKKSSFVAAGDAYGGVVFFPHWNEAMGAAAKSPKAKHWKTLHEYNTEYFSACTTGHLVTMGETFAKFSELFKAKCEAAEREHT